MADICEICMAMLKHCEEDKFKYEDRVLAQKCENWCRKHKSYNIEITKHAVR